MALKLSNQGAAIWLAMLVKAGLVVRLYKNDHEPKDTSTAADFVECDFPGYAPKVTAPADWKVTPGRVSVIDHPTILFEKDADDGLRQDAAGYCVTLPSGEYLWAEKFDEATTIRNVGDGQKITPRFELRK